MLLEVKYVKDRGNGTLCTPISYSISHNIGLVTNLPLRLSLSWAVAHELVRLCFVRALYISLCVSFPHALPPCTAVMRITSFIVDKISVQLSVMLERFFKHDLFLLKSVWDNYAFWL